PVRPESWRAWARRRGDVHQTLAHRDDHCLRPVVNAELAIGATDVVAQRLATDAQPAGYGFVAGIAGQGAKDLELARAERRQVLARSSDAGGNTRRLRHGDEIACATGERCRRLAQIGR